MRSVDKFPDMKLHYLDELLVNNVLPKKGHLRKAELEREQGETFAAMRR